MAGGRQAAFGLFAAALMAATPPHAVAQASAAQPANTAAVSLSLASDFRVRGVSMSDRQPALSLSFSEDLANGVYGGATVLGQGGRDGGLQMLGHVEYVGYAVRRPGGVAWDFGLNNQDFKLETLQPFHVRYSEVFAGISDGRFSARLFYAPDYLQQGIQVAYLDIGAVARPADGWRLSSHLGVFKPLAGFEGKPVRRTRYDARLDLVRRVGRFDLDLGWATAAPAPAPDSRRSRPALIAAATAFF